MKSQVGKVGRFEALGFDQDMCPGTGTFAYKRVLYSHTVDGSEILHHLGCIRLCKWDIYHINW